MSTNNKLNDMPTAVKDKYIEDLSKYTVGQLLEMKERQMKLLLNK